jgi:NAD(P)-dependent dehydrogenase (short-subunit alcohol dehydrogenase family)
MKRIIVITGASRGLGLALAKKFVDLGDTVFGISRTRKYWPAAKRAVPSDHFKLLAGDITSEKTVKTLLAGIRRRAGQIDILINNAGYCAPLAPVEKISLAEFRMHFKQNLDTAFLMCKHATPIMKKQKRGLIMNVSSMAGIRAVPRLVAYSASKFGVLALSQAIAKENSETGLRCITVCPGGMNTEMRRELFGAEDAVRQQTPEFVSEIMALIAEGKIPRNRTAANTTSARVSRLRRGGSARRSSHSRNPPPASASRWQSASTNEPALNWLHDQRYQRGNALDLRQLRVHLRPRDRRPDMAGAARNAGPRPSRPLVMPELFGRPGPVHGARR